MNNIIVNASPQIINLGAKDMSLKPTPPRPIVIPTHTPLIFGYAASGPATKTLVDGGRLMGLYGKETFDRNLPYFTHGARVAELMAAAGNAMMFVRIIPEDNDTIANSTLYLDVLKDDVDVYKRHEDGSVAYDADGNPIVDKTVKGYKLKVLAQVYQDDVTTPVGIKTSRPGYMTDADGNTSTMYPILEVRGSYKGSKYNNIGYALNLPTIDTVNEGYIKGNLALPFEFTMFKRPNATTSGSVIKNLFGMEKEQFVFKKDAKDPSTNRKVNLESILGDWSNLTSPLMDLVYPNIEKPYVYYSNLDLINKNIMEVEAEYVNADVTTVEDTIVNTAEWMDFVTDVPASEQFGIINPFNAMSTKRVPAFTYVIDNAPAAIRGDEIKEVYISGSTPIYLGAGKDGTLSDANYEAGVSAWMDKYLDKNSEVMDLAVNLENALYDSGFDLPTKKDLVNFITVRKDTFLGLSTRIQKLGDKYADLVTDRAIAANLKARLALAPESTFFGTPVTRAIVVAGSGIDILDPAETRYGLLLDIAYKAARMMGGAKWKKELIFDRGDKNIILNYKDIQPEFIPGGIKPDLWNLGIVWAQPYDERAYHFPAMQSVYDNDTSVLNNIFMALALTVTNKVAAAAQRKFTGDTSMSPNEFIDAVETYMNNELGDKFAQVITVTVKALISDYDAKRGYSWTVVSKLGGNVMKTVMTHYIEAWNKADL